MDAVAFMRGNRAYFEDFITRSTYHSNAIEGSTLSYAETYAILWNDNSLQVTATARELYEAINHKYALSLALEDMQAPLSERLVKEIARAINKNINEIGGYRTVSVLIRGAEHIPPKPMPRMPSSKLAFLRVGRGSSRSRPPGMTSISTVRVGRAWAPCCCRGWGSGARAALLIRSPSSTSRSYAVKDTGNARLACPIIGTSVQA